MRVALVGNSGSGKSTQARQVAAIRAAQRFFPRTSSSTCQSWLEHLRCEYLLLPLPFQTGESRRAVGQAHHPTQMARQLADKAQVPALGRVNQYRFSGTRRRAVTSISMRMRGSARPALIIVAAGRTSPKQRRSTGQHSSNSAATGTM